MLNFWQSLQKPIIALAPMEDVTDTVFREVIRSVSEPDALHVMFTEFTSTDGLCNKKGREFVASRLVVNETERELLKVTNTKLVAQIWGSDPEKFHESAKLISAMGLFDGIDINMGCPVKKVVKNRSCSALINYPQLAREIIVATKEGSDLPVSVKTRIGFNTTITEQWIGELLDEHPAAIGIHGRTQKMLSTGEVMWDEIGKAVQLRNERKSETIILGNGDVDSYPKAIENISRYGVDGVMIGKGVFKNPWIFNKIQEPISMEKRIALLRKHIALYDSSCGKKQNFNVLKRFFKIYINGFDGAAYCRDRLLQCRDGVDTLEVLKIFELKSEETMLKS